MLEKNAPTQMKHFHSGWKGSCDVVARCMNGSQALGVWGDTFTTRSSGQTHESGFFRLSRKSRVVKQMQGLRNGMKSEGLDKNRGL